MKPEFSNSIEQFLLNERVLTLVSEQLNKDLYPYIDWPIQTIFQRDFVSIITYLSKALRDLDLNNHGDMLAMLYRIDVPQAQYVRSMESGQTYTHLANQILDRELKKVLFRLHFDRDSK